MTLIGKVLTLCRDAIFESYMPCQVGSSNWKYITGNNVIYWPLTELSIKRCTCVNKRKNIGSRWTRDNNISRCPGRLKSVGVKIPEWEPAADRGLWTLSDPRLSKPSQDEKEVLLWSEELGSKYQSLSVSNLSLTHNNITLSRIKCERLYFENIFKCYRLNSFKEFSIGSNNVLQTTSESPASFSDGLLV